MKTVNIAIFASGSGTNAENIANYFKTNKNIKVKLILSNNENAFVLKRAQNLDIESISFNRKDFYESEKVINLLLNKEIDFIVLAGFLWLVPQNILNNFDGKIINIHPALLPNYGGKGMFGDHVHKAVLENNEKESGITIHYVNEKYDDGDIIFQEKVSVDTKDTVESLAKKIHELEYKYFPKVIFNVINQQFGVD
jgi:phosphoribosylglycinamide formyltransferase-1